MNLSLTDKLLTMEKTYNDKLDKRLQELEEEFQDKKLAVEREL